MSISSKNKGHQSWVIAGMLILVSLACVVPLLLVFSISLTKEEAIIRHGFRLIPSQFSLDAYRTIFTSGQHVGRSYIVSISVTVLGTLLSVIITAMAGFALANPAVKGRTALNMFFFFTMVFNGGMVPWYMICRMFGLTNNFLSLIIPSLLFNPFNLFLTRNYMRELPIALMESARLDGANDGRIAFQIYLPLSMPILATIALFTAIGYWNDWWNAIMLVNDEKLYPVQYLLMRLKSDLNMMKALQGSVSGGRSGLQPAESLQMATVVVTLGPIIIFYPLLQKHIVKGLVMGSVKE